MKNLQKTGLKFFTIFCVLAIVSSCGGGGGGTISFGASAGGSGGYGSSGGGQGVEVVPVSKVSSSLNNSYGLSNDSSIIISVNSDVSKLETPLYAKNAKVQSIKTNSSAKGEGIYSEALKQMGITQTNLLLTIDGVTTEYNFSPSDTLVLKQVEPGTKVIASGTVQTQKRTCNIVQKEYDIEAFQESLPLFIEYNATLKDRLGKELVNFTYSTDKPIELPVLNDITVEDGQGEILGVAPFLGWQVTAPGLSIDKNFYAKGATVPAGELCGDIDFYADYGFCVYQDNDNEKKLYIEDVGIEMIMIMKGDDVELSFANVNGDAIIFDNANVTNGAISNLTKSATSKDIISAKTLGNTTISVAGKSLRGNNYTVQIPVVVGDVIKGQPKWASGSGVFKDGGTVKIYAKWCSDHEVTQGEYKSVMENTQDTSKLPARYASLYDALVYCNKRSIKEGLTPCYKINGSTNPDTWGTVPTGNDATWNDASCDFSANGYRLPTEAEWEYFARGKEAYSYSGSNRAEYVSWYKDTSSNSPHEVKSLQPNAFGLYDMSGNVWEWCWDEPGREWCVVRGGAFNSRYKYSLVAQQGDSRQVFSRNKNVGFRVVRSAK